jgi:hypothetical protein
MSMFTVSAWGHEFLRVAGSARPAAGFEWVAGGWAAAALGGLTFIALALTVLGLGRRRR